VLENQLLLVPGFENHRVLVERPDSSGQFHSTYQVNGDVVPLFTGGIKERILNILLRRLGFHLPISFVQVRCCATVFGEGNWSQPLSS
jgi:hypothetical protein